LAKAAGGDCFLAKPMRESDTAKFNERAAFGRPFFHSEKKGFILLPALTILPFWNSMQEIAS
jgi:hypothetical protein